MILEGVEGVFGLGGCKDDHGGIGDPVQQVETIGAGHLDVEEEQVNPFLVEVFKGFFYVQKMPFHFDEGRSFHRICEENPQQSGYLLL